MVSGEKMTGKLDPHAILGKPAPDDAGYLPEHRPGYVVTHSDAPDWTKQDMAAIAHVKGQYAKWIEQSGGHKGRQVMPHTWNSPIVRAYRENGGDYIRAVTPDVLTAAWKECDDPRYWGWGCIERVLSRPSPQQAGQLKVDLEYAALPLAERKEWEQRVWDSGFSDSDWNRLQAEAAKLWRKEKQNER